MEHNTDANNDFSYLKFKFIGLHILILSLTEM